MKNITTGVDKLMDIVSDKKKISVEDAAKELGVGKDVIQEWAEFLEQEGLISIDYKLSKVWLYEKKITTKDVLSTAKEVASEKDAFMRKIDVVIKTLERETLGFEEVRKQFKEIHRNIKDEIETVKVELAELEQYENLKRTIDKDIEKQMKYYEQEINKYFEEIKKDEERYNELIKKVDSEKEAVEEAHKKISGIVKKKDEIQETIRQAIKDLKENEKTLNQETKNILDSQKNISKLLANAETISNDIKNKKEKTVTELLDKMEFEKEAKQKEQEDLLKKAKEKTQEMMKYQDAGKKIYDSFKGFFLKRIKTEELIGAIDREKALMKKELEELRNKTQAFSLMTKNKDIKKEMEEIKKKIKKVEDKKNGLMKKIEHLVDYIKGK